MTTKPPFFSVLGALAVLASALLGGCAVPPPPDERVMAEGHTYDEQRVRQAVRMLPVIRASQAPASAAAVPARFNP